MLLSALAITPLATILHWSELIGVRRTIGGTTLAYTIAHLVIFFALRFWNFASIVDEMVTRASLISATVATIGLIAMGATSVDSAIRHMGPQAWNRLHNAIYAIAALALTHYLLSPDDYPEQYSMTGIFFWLMLWRVLKAHGYGTDIRALLGLALASGLFTMTFEAGWLFAFHEYAASETLYKNLTLVPGVSPAWKVLALGVLVAIARAIRQSFGFKTSGLVARKFV
jgi:methionine sulfoxide reductase heme-binding subunit